jgi:hypothetical protein
MTALIVFLLLVIGASGIALLIDYEKRRIEHQPSIAPQPAIAKPHLGKVEQFAQKHPRGKLFWALIILLGLGALSGGKNSNNHYSSTSGFSPAEISEAGDRMQKSINDNLPKLRSYTADLEYMSDIKRHMDESTRLRRKGDYAGARREDAEANRMMDKMDERDMRRGY